MIRVLIVDDQTVVRAGLAAIVGSDPDIEVVGQGSNGEEALGLVDSLSPDLVLMDLQMPVMNGIDSARRIREFSDVPIIALTANSTKQEQDKCFETGMNDYLAKPFKPQDLHFKIMSLNIVENLL